MLRTGLAALVAFFLAGCSPEPPTESGIQPEALLQALEGADPPLVLDVRTPGEYARGHVPGARNIPHTEVVDRLGELALERERPVVVYCERGGRAALAEAALRQAGFRVQHLAGDMAAWRAAGRPVEGP